MATEQAPHWHRWAERCESILANAIHSRADGDARLAEAMAYAALDGGKRMRPLLVYATGTALGASESTLDIPAAAIELIHAYSLVHDDLPAMDDDALRRGKPTVHVAYDEATAILAGDGLLTLAFELLGQAPMEPPMIVAMLQTLARAAGMQGMVAGQSIDLAHVGQSMSLEALRQMHGAKTGALIRCAVQLGALTANADATACAALDDFADALGLAFQIRDDILDVEGDPDLIGKTAGKDAVNAKPTYPALLGLDGSRALLAELAQRMDNALSRVPADTGELARLADFAATRAH
ncbi:polyprenyl synthetase family protein [Xanthomonadaceae bacterium XH05]|nr:polyprenyl synthetase family protein [Xanthomonadaceae bacterium XH05]